MAVAVILTLAHIGYQRHFRSLGSGIGARENQSAGTADVPAGSSDADVPIGAGDEFQVEQLLKQYSEAKSVTEKKISLSLLSSSAKAAGDAAKIVGLAREDDEDEIVKAVAAAAYVVDDKIAQEAIVGIGDEKMRQKLQRHFDRIKIHGYE